MVRNIVIAGLFLAFGAFVALALGGQTASQPAKPAVPGIPAAPAQSNAEPGLVVEGLSEPEVMIGLEQLGAIEAPMQKVEDATSAAGWSLTVPEGPNHKELHLADKSVNGTKTPNGTATFKFTIDTPGDYVLWVHKRWCCSCGDSFRFALDDGPLKDFISDSNYEVWEWAASKAGKLRLAKGSHTLTIANREDGFRADRLLLTMGTNKPAPLKSK
jgi:hypothetical protein